MFLFAAALGCGPARGPVAATVEPAPPPVLWREPAVTRAATPPIPPRPPFTFVEEDRGGVSPKFLVRDGAGRRWQVKLGPEARTEMAAARLLTHAGYLAEEMHLLRNVDVDGLRLSRGHEFVRDGTVATLARFEARDERFTRDEPWDWAANPFVGTVQLDGLKAMMLLINNYDARTDNNRVIVARGPTGALEARYIVADIGASFGRYGGLGGPRTKSDPEGFAETAFIERVVDGRVRFGFFTHPVGWGRLTYVLNPFYAAGQLKKERDLQNLPVESVRWIGGILGRMRPADLRGAFETAGFDQADTASFVATLQTRIEQMRDISDAPPAAARRTE